MLKKTVAFLYQWIVFVPVFLLLTIFTALTTTIGCRLGGERIFAYYPGMIWSRLTCWLALCPVKVKGKEKLNRRQSYIFIANHQGVFDIFLIYGFLGFPIKWLMKKSLRNIPLVGTACQSAGFIFVDTSSPKAAAKTIAMAEKNLSKGASLMIFPEGSRTKDGHMRRFMKGAYQMAIDLKLPIAPITINGSYEVLPRSSKLVRRHKLELTIHDPFPIEEYIPEDISEMANVTRQTIYNGLWERYKGASNKNNEE